MGRHSTYAAPTGDVTRGTFVDVAWSTHPIAAIAVGEIAAELRERKHDRPDAMFLFTTRPFAGTLEDIAPALRRLVSPQSLIGCCADQIYSPDGWLVDDPAIAAFVVNDGEVATQRFAPGEPLELPDDSLSIVIAHERTFPLGQFTQASGGYTAGGPLVLDDSLYMDGAVALTFPAGSDVEPARNARVDAAGVLAFADLNFTDGFADDHEERPFVGGFASSWSFSNVFTHSLTVFGAKSNSETQRG